MSTHTFPTRRAPYLHETESTIAQSTTEDECSPFFVELDQLSEGQLDHLRNVGLLPPLPSGDAADDDACDDDVDEGGGRDGFGGAVEAEGKAARLLGVHLRGNDGPRIELLGGGETTCDVSEVDGNTKGGNFDPYAIRLLRDKHVSYLTNALSNPLPRGFASLDASHPWMVYWCLHSLDLLGYFDVLDDVNKNQGGGCLNGGGLGSGNDALKEVEVLQKSHLLERIVSTLQHCWTDVTVTFTAEEVAKDVRLRTLHEEQSNSSSNNTTSSEREGESISIIGGGYGGGPQQMPHVAPTYAGVLALCIVACLGLGSSSSTHHPFRQAGRLAMDELNRRRLQLYAFFLSLREREGRYGEDEERMVFRMQHDGEVDVRASYCILAPCYLLGFLKVDANDDNPLLHPSISRHIAACQTFEGGFGAEPYNEAHGGYTFCALAALRILNSVSIIDVNALSSWLARRQMGYEGGFCGRTNKLVDGCYSFWQGGAVAVLDGWLNEKENESGSKGVADEEGANELSFDEVMLQRYILLCAQDVNGGLRDKPSKPKDFYHSCYVLSGLSAAQHALEPWPPSTSKQTATGNEKKEEGKFNRLFGDADVNIVGRTDPVINIRLERVQFMLAQKF